MISTAFKSEVCIGALTSTLSSNTALIGELELQLASRSSAFVLAAANIETSKSSICCGKGVVGLMQEQAQNQGPQLCETEAACIAAQGAQCTAESSFLSLCASELAFRWELEQSHGG